MPYLLKISRLFNLLCVLMFSVMKWSVLWSPFTTVKHWLWCSLCVGGGFVIIFILIFIVKTVPYIAASPGEKSLCLYVMISAGLYTWPAVAETTSVIFLDIMTNIKLCNWYHLWFLPICSTFTDLCLSSRSQWHQIYLCAALSLTLTLIQGDSGIKLKVDILSHNPVKFKMIVQILGLRSYTLSFFYLFLIFFHYAIDNFSQFLTLVQNTLTFAWTLFTQSFSFPLL